MKYKGSVAAPASSRRKNNIGRKDKPDQSSLHLSLTILLKQRVEHMPVHMRLTCMRKVWMRACSSRSKDKHEAVR